MRRVIAVAIAAVALSSLAGCERWALDEKMEELCAKDGGVKVYEKVTLPASDFTNLGEPLGRYLTPDTPQDARYGPDYKYVVKEEILIDKNAKGETGKGRLGRIHYTLYRRADGKLLGEAVLYMRGGGDGITFGFHPSSNACPLRGADLAQSVFAKGE